MVAGRTLLYHCQKSLVKIVKSTVEIGYSGRDDMWKSLLRRNIYEDVQQQVYIAARAEVLAVDSRHEVPLFSYGTGRISKWNLRQKAPTIYDCSGINTYGGRIYLLHYLGQVIEGKLNTESEAQTHNMQTHNMTYYMKTPDDYIVDD